MIKELDTIVLTKDIDQYGLKKGDMGAVVHLYSDSKTLEAEFVTAEGKTVAVLTLSREDVRPLSSKDILHVREFETA